MVTNGSTFIGVGFLTCTILSAASPAVGRSVAQPAPLSMEKYVSKEAVFVLYKPKGWVVKEGGRPDFRTISVTDPDGLYETAMFYGTNPTGNDVLALANRFVAGIARQFPDLALSNVMISRDRCRIMFTASFTNSQKGKRFFRCWVSGAQGEFVYSSIEGPAEGLAGMMPVLLTVLSNVRVFKGAFAPPGAMPIQVDLVPYRLADGSASFVIPRGWQCQEFGKGCFLAGEASEGFAFTIANVDVITPQLGVTVPGVPVLPYLRPTRALQTLAESQGLATDMKFEAVFPRQDVASEMARVYTCGTVTVEEFLFTCNTRTGKSKGYTFGFSFGSRLGTNWGFRHMTVMAPVDKFDQFTGHFASMLQSYRIDDRWAANYVAQGMARLRQLQQQTAQIIARNAHEIHEMMQAAYDERQRSMDYIDYQRTSYIRGEQDWVSSTEGGTVYHTDTWGTRNTTTGQSWEGKPYDYVNFDGRNPKHNEDMIPINSRQLWERHIR